MRLKFGLVGLPNVGKSTLFNALTNASVGASNFPFCTIKPNIGMVLIPDYRLNEIAKILKPRRISPATMQFIDIAGLVKGASRGEGLGNQFLKHIRETEAIGHVVRCFKDKNIVHISGRINPAEDIDTVNNELIFSDFNTCENAIRRILKSSRNSYTKNVKIELEILEKCLFHLENFCVLRSLNLNKEEKMTIRYLNFLTLKPTMYIANVDEGNFERNPYFNQIIKIAKKENSVVVPVCASFEESISKLNEEERLEFIQASGFVEPGINRVIRESYILLNMQTFFTSGLKEVRAWIIPIGTTALQAAGKVHTDFEKGFIRAKTISYEDFIKYKGEQGAKEIGKVRIEGKNYILKDGDIMHFFFNV